MSRLERLEFYALAFFGSMAGQWTMGLAKHLWYAVLRHVTVRF